VKGGIMKAAFLAVALLGGTAAMAQPGNPIGTNLVFTAPTGNCSPGGPNFQVVSTGVQYSCQNVAAGTGVGTWAPIGATAGNPAGSNTNVQYNNSGSFGANSNFTTDGSGNVTSVTLNTSSTLNLPVSAITVLNDFIASINLAGSTDAGDALALQGWAQINGAGTATGDAHAVGVKGIVDYYGSGSIPKSIGVEGALTNDSTGTIANAIGVQAFFGGNLSTGTLTSYSEFQADANANNPNGTISRYIDFHSPPLVTSASQLFCTTQVAANSCFSLLNEDANKVIETYGSVAVGNTYPQAKFHVFGCSSGLSYPSGLSAASLFESCASSGATYVIYSLTPAGGGLEVMGNGYVGIGTASPPANPLEIAANGDAIHIGDTITNPTWMDFDSKAFFGEDTVNNNTIVQGIAGKGIGFLCNNSTFGSGYCALLESSGTLSVGTTTSSSTNPFKVTQVGDVTALSLTSSHLVSAPGIISSGTQFTASGCSNTITEGGSTSGTFSIGAASCNVLITLGISTVNAWSCHANDETTAAGNTLLHFTTARSGTQVTLSVPSTAVSADVIDFFCAGS
jgi:hypothetical protein